MSTEDDIKTIGRLGRLGKALWGIISVLAIVLVFVGGKAWQLADRFSDQEHRIAALEKRAEADDSRHRDLGDTLRQMGKDIGDIKISQARVEVHLGLFPPKRLPAAEAAADTILRQFAVNALRSIVAGMLEDRHPPPMAAEFDDPLEQLDQ